MCVPVRVIKVQKFSFKRARLGMIVLTYVKTRFFIFNTRNFDNENGECQYLIVIPI